MKACTMVLGIIILCCLSAPGTSEAITTTCLPTPLPAGPQPGNATFSVHVQSSSHEANLTLWRHGCVDGSQDFALLLRVAPSTPAFFTCGSDFFLLQNGQQFDVRFVQAITATSPFCNDIVTPTTLLVGFVLAGNTIFDKTQGFTLLYKGTVNLTDVNFTMPVAAAGLIPVSPPAITVVSTGCNPCHSGQVVAFRADITNAGPPVLAEMKGGARFPDGSVLTLLNQTTTIASGASSITLVPSQTLPGGLPTIDLLVEAAVLDPALGTTQSRHNVLLRLLP
jgi:hypothetical protein